MLLKYSARDATFFSLERVPAIASAVSANERIPNGNSPYLPSEGATRKYGFECGAASLPLRILTRAARSTVPGAVATRHHALRKPYGFRTQFANRFPEAGL